MAHHIGFLYNGGNLSSASLKFEDYKLALLSHIVKHKRRV